MWQSHRLKLEYRLDWPRLDLDLKHFVEAHRTVPAVLQGQRLQSRHSAVG